MSTGTGPSDDSLETSFEDLYDRAPCGYLSMTTSGIIIKVNQTLVDWTGYPRDELVGRTLSSFLDKGSQLFYETRYIPVLRLQRELREVSMTLKRVDNSRLPILLNSMLVEAEGDQPEVIRTAIFDATSRRDYELELLHSRQAAEESETRVRVLQNAASDFLLADSEFTVAQALVDSAREAFSATETAVFLLDDAGTLQLVAGHSPIVDLVPVEATRPGVEAVRTQEFISLSNLEEALAFSPSVADAMHATRMEALTVIPLIDDAGVIGTLGCFYERGRRFDDEFANLQTALARQASAAFARVALQRRLQHSALHDQLTGLANRALLEERMAEALGGARRSGHPLSVLFLDLDGFKAVNDHLGHVVGDSTLRQVADRLLAEVRLTDIVGRFGGDEFIILCPDTDEGAALTIAERIRGAIARPFDGVLPQFPITVSIGVAAHRPGDGDITTDALFTMADEAMYRSKNAGKDCVTLARV